MPAILLEYASATDGWTNTASTAWRQLRPWVEPLLALANEQLLLIVLCIALFVKFSKSAKVAIVASAAMAGLFYFTASHFIVPAVMGWVQYPGTAQSPSRTGILIPQSPLSTRIVRGTIVCALTPVRLFELPQQTSPSSTLGQGNCARVLEVILRSAGNCVRQVRNRQRHCPKIQWLYLEVMKRDAH